MRDSMRSQLFLQELRSGVPVSYRVNALPREGDMTRKLSRVVGTGRNGRVHRGIQDVPLKGLKAVCDLRFRRYLRLRSVPVPAQVPARA